MIPLLMHRLQMERSLMNEKNMIAITAQMGAPTFDILDADDFSLPEETVVMYSEKPSPDVVLEMHDPDMLSKLDEIHEPEEIQIVVDDLPGVEALDPELEQVLEVNDNDTVESNQSQKAIDTSSGSSKKSKVDPKWDWESKGAQGFVAWIKERIDGIPGHSGYDTAGIERAISYMEKLDGEISRAMRLDLDGELDANKIEEVRSKIDDGIERLHERLEKVKAKKGKGSKRKKKSDLDLLFVKKAQKAPNMMGVVITVPLLISRIVRSCINGMISAGHDIEWAFQKQVDYYKLTVREKAECMQLFADMGMPIRQDRGLPLDEDVDMTSSDNIDWAANYQG